jgi:predicted nucleic acid-binding protein
MGSEVSVLIKKFLTESRHVQWTESFFKWQLLNDQDDNKFSDCYLASGSDYLITHDNGFQKLSKLDFPSFSIVSAEQFKKILDGSS